jgi:tRNA nucleotidyltransferase (CCA-adding enzyme)
LRGLDIDWSLPRKDSEGRKPRVEVDPHMPFEKAFARRDLTINAMGIDLVTGELIDPFNGKYDLEHKILRVPDPQLFVQDPLRFYRVMQFISRFGMEPDAQLNKIAATMSLKDISIERVEMEFNKLMLKSKHPSWGIRWLKYIKRLPEILPELAATIGVPQPLQYHPEGDVFEHTMQALDAAASLSYDDIDQQLICMYAVLCHDLGKAVTTTVKDDRIRSLNHAHAGVALTKSMLKRIMTNKERIVCVARLVEHHMAPLTFIKGGAKTPAYKRLALKLAPCATIEMLGKVAIADRCGRNADGHEPLKIASPDVKKFIATAKRVGVLNKVEERILQGRDLLDLVKPGPKLGRLVDYAYELQIEQGIKDKAELKKLVLKKLANIT